MICSYIDMPHQTHIPTSITHNTPIFSYGIVVIFITACVASGGAVDNESVGTVLLWRFVYTISACVAYLLSLFIIWIPTEKNMIALSLSKQARSVHAYCREVMAPRDNDSDESAKLIHGRERSIISTQARLPSRWCSSNKGFTSHFG